MSGSVDVLLLADRPFNEEIARYGPFVMNTREEIFEAFQDYQQGKMGMINWFELEMIKKA